MCRCVAVWGCCVGAVALACTDPPPAQPDPDSPVTNFATAEAAASARSTAIALNYCRASFYRLKQNPSKRVLLEEQEKILNNLNLNGIADQEVITLYSGVLEEIGRTQIAARERVVIQEAYRRTLRRETLAKAFVLSAQLAQMQYFDAVRTGANGWWDYRSINHSRELDVWKVEKTRLTEMLDKSTKFLDTFWKMAQKKQIPDRWLVREDDLEQLERASREADPEVRLRVLQRMERFMECYPPYWYALARTQQSLGQFQEAAATFRKLAELGRGHFRKDDMLASGLANLAAIEFYLGDRRAPATARAALEFSDDVWQANLVCARILHHHGDTPRAEDAVLRNLDVELETVQSRNSLIALYCESGQVQKLAGLLNRSDQLATVPIPLLLQAAATLGSNELPQPAMRQIVATLYGYELNTLGRRSLMIVAQPAWELDRAHPVVASQGAELARPRFYRGKVSTQMQVVDARPNGEITLELHYDDAVPIRLTLQHGEWPEAVRDHAEELARKDSDLPELKSLFVPRRKSGYLITAVDFGGRHVALNDKTQSGAGLDDDGDIEEGQETAVDRRTSRPVIPVQPAGSSRETPAPVESAPPAAAAPRSGLRSPPSSNRPPSAPETVPAVELNPQIEADD